VSDSYTAVRGEVVLSDRSGLGVVLNGDLVERFSTL
jgi:hypothetical protein